MTAANKNSTHDASGMAPHDSRVLFLAGLVLLVPVAHAAAMIDLGNKMDFLASAGLHSIIYLFCVWWVLNRPTTTRDLIVILIAAALMRGLAVTALPYLTTDAFRYVWDGRIQWAGFNPYAHVPADPDLAHLRDDTLYPHINQREKAVTIYPPMAQLIFMGSVAIENGIGGMKAMMLLFEAATIVALIGWLRADSLPPARVLIYAWHPLPIWEFASQAHVDAALAAFVTLGIWAAVRHRQALCGALFACAVLVKYFPLVLLPALWRRWDWRLPTTLIATAAILYLPYLAGHPANLAGFLSKHIANEGYEAGYGFHSIWLLRDFSLADPPAAVHVIPALIVLGALALWIQFARPRDTIKPEHIALLGAAFVFFSSPHYAWYFGFLVPLAVRVPHPALLAMTLLCISMNAPQKLVGNTIVYTLTFYVPLLIWIGTELWRSKRKPHLSRSTCP